MSDQNSAVERQIRPDEAMELLGIKKDAYYDRLKFLGIKTQKDADGKAYLLPEQFGALERLGSWISATGKMEGFVNSNSALIAPGEGWLASESAPQATASEPCADQMDELIRAAAEMKAQQIVLPDMVIRELAGRMSFSDLPQDLQDKVTSFREGARPNFQAATIASNLLDQWRSKQAAQAVA